MENETSNPGDKVRIAVRLSNEYILRSLRMLSQLSNGDLLTGLVAMAIAQANVAELDRNAGSARLFDDIDTLPPDELRRPVSVLAISTSLGLPYETTRRHVAKLSSVGVCARVKGGVIVSSSALDTELNRAVLTENLVNLRRLFRGLRNAEVGLE